MRRVTLVGVRRGVEVIETKKHKTVGEPPAAGVETPGKTEARGNRQHTRKQKESIVGPLNLGLVDAGLEERESCVGPRAAAVIARGRCKENE